ncbi:hypothetical protein BaRGS_00017592 [Batillaria attramentaria]|uniref:Uncharacterized protein n=1 Tax=Batillaria attramentaria TaxID=370345 RepID=A0ABD0KWJ3_9CAEN
MYFCLLPKLHELNSDFLNVSDTLGCPRPCDYIAYHPTVSLSYFPSHVAEQELQRVGYVRNGTDMRSDFLELLFHFEEVIMYETKHVEVYTAKNLMGTIGGNMGFFLGASVLSICEILNVLLALCIVCAKRLSRKISGL